MSKEILVKVDNGQLTPITRSELQDGDVVVRLYTDKRHWRDPEFVQVQMCFDVRRGPCPETHFSEELKYKSMWVNEDGTIRQEVDDEHEYPTLKVFHVPDPNPWHKRRCEILDMAKEWIMVHLVGDEHEEPTSLHLTLEDEDALRRDMLAEGIDYFGTLEDPVRPETVLGFNAAYDAQETMFE